MNEKNRPTGMGPAQSLAGGSTVLSVAPATDIAPYDFPLDPIYEAKLLVWAQGWRARQSEIDRLNSEADRYYRAAYNPRPRIDPNRPSYSQLERLRGNDEHANEIVAANARRFAEVSL